MYKILSKILMKFDTDGDELESTIELNNSIDKINSRKISRQKNR